MAAIRYVKIKPAKQAKAPRQPKPKKQRTAQSTPKPAKPKAPSKARSISKVVRGTAVAPVNVQAMSKQLAAAKDAGEVLQMEKQLDAIEHTMTAAGLYSPDEIREVNELRMRARWRLGKLLALMERAGPPPGRGKNISRAGKHFGAYLAEIGLDKNRAQEAQRIGALPPSELEKALAEARKRSVLNSYAGLVIWSRPYWFKENRQRRHENIAEAAEAAAAERTPEDKFGREQFGLIYADPPWKFETYSEQGLDRTPDQHYPTLTDEEIANFVVDGLTVEEVAGPACALLMWCTSSNVDRALRIMRAWGFAFKSSAVWVKDKSGLGLVFRNKHEILLYGTKGDMPGPQYQPLSVFEYPRGKHSEKPTDIRVEIEKMYPAFNETSRLELFARDAVEGWSVYGFEAMAHAAE